MKRAALLTLAIGAALAAAWIGANIELVCESGETEPFDAAAYPELRPLGGGGYQAPDGTIWLPYRYSDN